MDINIRESIKDNFKDASIDEIKASIESSITEGDEVTLPGVGVFFELLWNSCNDDERNFILKKLEETLKA
jgi:small acid-soluble spore protein I (minor)